MARIGPKMARVVFLVKHGPRTVIDVAVIVGPHGSLQYGYAIVRRAVKAGLVRYAAPLPGRRGKSLEIVKRSSGSSHGN